MISSPRYVRSVPFRDVSFLRFWRGLQGMEGLLESSCEVLYERSFGVIAEDGVTALTSLTTCPSFLILVGVHAN